jgi:hypothetical protein
MRPRPEVSDTFTSEKIFKLLHIFRAVVRDDGYVFTPSGYYFLASHFRVIAGRRGSGMNDNLTGENIYRAKNIEFHTKQIHVFHIKLDDLSGLCGLQAIRFAFTFMSPFRTPLFFGGDAKSMIWSNEAEIIIKESHVERPQMIVEGFREATSSTKSTADTMTKPAIIALYGLSVTLAFKMNFSLEGVSETIPVVSNKSIIVNAISLQLFQQAFGGLSIPFAPHIGNYLS